MLLLRGGDLKLVLSNGKIKPSDGKTAQISQIIIKEQIRCTYLGTNQGVQIHQPLIIPDEAIHIF